MKRNRRFKVLLAVLLIVLLVSPFIGKMSDGPPKTIFVVIWSASMGLTSVALFIIGLTDTRR